MTTTKHAVQYRITLKFLESAKGKNTAVLRNSVQTGADMGVSLRNFENIHKAVNTIRKEYEQLGYTVENFIVEHTPSPEYDVHTAIGTVTRN